MPVEVHDLLSLQQGAESAERRLSIECPQDTMNEKLTLTQGLGDVHHIG